MLKKFFTVCAIASFAISGQSYADDTKNATRDAPEERIFIVTDTKEEARDDAELASDEQDSKEDARDAAELACNECDSEAKEDAGSSLAACGNGHCPSEMIDALRKSLHPEQNGESQQDSTQASNENAEDSEEKIA